MDHAKPSSRHKTVFDAVLRVDAKSWDGPAPFIDNEPPVTIHVDQDGKPSQYVYGFFPTGSEIDLDAACSLLERMLTTAMEQEGSILRDPSFVSRCRLDIALSVDGDYAMYSYIWPNRFLRAIAAAGLGLEVSHYVAHGGNGADASKAGERH